MSALWGRCRGVSAMAGKRRLNLSFSLTSPQQRDAWHILSSIPAGQRTDAVCRMVCKAHEQDALLSAIRGLIREELRNLDLTTEKSQQAQAEDMDENVLGFLLALQQEGDSPGSAVFERIQCLQGFETSFRREQ